MSRLLSLLSILLSFVFCFSISSAVLASNVLNCNNQETLTLPHRGRNVTLELNRRVQNHSWLGSVPVYMATPLTDNSFTVGEQDVGMLNNDSDYEEYFTPICFSTDGRVVVIHETSRDPEYAFTARRIVIPLQVLITKLF